MGHARSQEIPRPVLGFIAPSPSKQWTICPFSRQRAEISTLGMGSHTNAQPRGFNGLPRGKPGFALVRGFGDGFPANGLKGDVGFSQDHFFRVKEDEIKATR